MCCNAVGADAEPEEEWLTLRTAICATEHARAAAVLAHASLEPPVLSPSKDLLEAPIWTTWARHVLFCPCWHLAAKLHVLLYVSHSTDWQLLLSTCYILRSY